MSNHATTQRLKDDLAAVLRDAELLMQASAEYGGEKTAAARARIRESLDAAKRIEFGPFGEWRAPARLYMNVERAYREFRNDPPNAPWDTAGTFDAIYQVAKAKGIEGEY